MVGGDPARSLSLLMRLPGAALRLDLEGGAGTIYIDLWELPRPILQMLCAGLLPARAG